MPFTTLSGTPPLPYGPYGMSGNKVRIIFHSDGNGARSGFMAGIIPIFDPAHNTTIEPFVTSTTTPPTSPHSTTTTQYHNHTTATTTNPFYTTYPPVNCNQGLVHIDTYANLTSPHYPNNYENFQHCIWDFEGPQGSRLEIIFRDFRVSNRNNKMNHFFF